MPATASIDTNGNLLVIGIDANENIQVAMNNPSATIVRINNVLLGTFSLALDKHVVVYTDDGIDETRLS